MLRPTSDRTPTDLLIVFLPCSWFAAPCVLVCFLNSFCVFIELCKSMVVPVFLRLLYPVTYRTHSRNIACVYTLHAPSDVLTGFGCFYLSRIYVSLTLRLLAMEGEHTGCVDRGAFATGLAWGRVAASAGWLPLAAASSLCLSRASASCCLRASAFCCSRASASADWPMCR